MQCPHCGTLVDKEDHICYKCGQLIKPFSSQSSMQSALIKNDLVPGKVLTFKSNPKDLFEERDRKALLRTISALAKRANIRESNYADAFYEKVLTFNKEAKRSQCYSIFQGLVKSLIPFKAFLKVLENGGAIHMVSPSLFDEDLLSFPKYAIEATKANLMAMRSLNFSGTEDYVQLEYAFNILFENYKLIYKNAL